MVDNLGLVLGPIVALIFLLGGIQLLRGAGSRFGALCIVAGAVLFLGAQLYGVLTLRPYVGRFFDEEWHSQIAAVEIVGTLGLLLCASGLVVHAYRRTR